MKVAFAVIHNLLLSDREAEIVGKIVEEKLQFPVECLVSLLKKEDTGLYLTKTE